MQSTPNRAGRIRSTPDAVNHADFPSPLLHPGETYCQKIVYRFGVC